MRRSTRGMTLLEVMIALAVLALGAVGAFSTVIYASRSLGTGSNVERGTVLAQSLLTALMAVPATARGTGNAGGVNNLFTNVSTTNDGDVADTGQVFVQAVLPAGSFDHAESEIASTAFASLVAPLGPGYERYWNIAPIVTGSTNGVVIAVIVRWHETTVWRRTVVIGTRYFP